MFVKVTRKKLKIRKNDYRSPKGSLATLLPTKHERASQATKYTKSLDVVERYAIIFELAESYRNEEKKPRQRIVSYLGTIREDEIKSTVSRTVFWNDIDAKFLELALAPQVEKKLRSTLQIRVP